jgi:hypothetical protein
MLRLDGIQRILEEKINGNQHSFQFQCRAAEDGKNGMFQIISKYYLFFFLLSKAYETPVYYWIDTGMDCADILQKFPTSRNKNGVYNITGPQNDNKAVYCDMTTDNGGWTVCCHKVVVEGICYHGNGNQR